MGQLDAQSKIFLDNVNAQEGPALEEMEIPIARSAMKELFLANDCVFREVGFVKNYAISTHDGKFDLRCYYPVAEQKRQSGKVLRKMRCDWASHPLGHLAVQSGVGQRDQDAPRLSQPTAPSRGVGP